MSNSDYYPWLNLNACQQSKIGLQWKYIAQQLRSICSSESELHPNLLTEMEMHNEEYFVTIEN